jgi:hypothetical protein
MLWRLAAKWGYSSTIRDISTRWRWVASFTPRPLYRRGKARGTHCVDGPRRRPGLDNSLLGQTSRNAYPMFVGPAFPVSPCNGPVRMQAFLSSAVGHSRVVLYFRLKRRNPRAHFNIYGTGEMVRHSSCKNRNRKWCAGESTLAQNYTNKFITCYSWTDYAYKMLLVILFMALFLRSSFDRLSTSYYSWRGQRR